MGTIGVACGQYAKKRGITTSHIARTIGLSTDKVSRSFRGLRTLSADEFVNVCKVLRVDPDEIAELASTNEPFGLDNQKYDRTNVLAESK